MPQAAFALCMDHSNTAAAWQVLIIWRDSTFRDVAAPASTVTTAATFAGLATAGDQTRVLQVLSLMKHLAGNLLNKLSTDGSRSNSSDSISRTQGALVSGPVQKQWVADMCETLRRWMTPAAAASTLHSRSKRSSTQSSSRTASKAHAAAAAAAAGDGGNAAEHPTGASCCFNMQQLMWLVDTGLQLGVAAARLGLHDEAFTALQAVLAAGNLLQEQHQQQDIQAHGLHNHTRPVAVARSPGAIPAAAAAAGTGSEKGAEPQLPQQDMLGGPAVAAALIHRCVAALCVAASLLLQAPPKAEPAGAAAPEARKLQQAGELLAAAQQQLLEHASQQQQQQQGGDNYSNAASTFQQAGTATAAAAGAAAAGAAAAAAAPLSATAWADAAAVLPSLQPLQLLIIQLSFSWASNRGEERQVRQLLQLLVQHPLTSPTELKAAALESLQPSRSAKREAVAALAYSHMLRLAAAAVPADLTAMADAVTGMLALVTSHAVKVKAISKVAEVLSAGAAGVPAEAAAKQEQEQNLCSTAAAAAAAVAPSAYPAKNLQWLIATCWNAAVETSSSGDDETARHYLQLVAALTQAQKQQQQQQQQRHWLLDSQQYAYLWSKLQQGTQQNQQDGTEDPGSHGEGPEGGAAEADASTAATCAAADGDAAAEAHGAAAAAHTAAADVRSQQQQQHRQSLQGAAAAVGAAGVPEQQEAAAVSPQVGCQIQQQEEQQQSPSDAPQHDPQQQCSQEQQEQLHHDYQQQQQQDSLQASEQQCCSQGPTVSAATKHQQEQQQQQQALAAGPNVDAICVHQQQSPAQAPGYQQTPGQHSPSKSVAEVEPSQEQGQAAMQQQDLSTMQTPTAAGRPVVSHSVTRQQQQQQQEEEEDCEQDLQQRQLQQEEECEQQSQQRRPSGMLNSPSRLQLQLQQNEADLLGQVGEEDGTSQDQGQQQQARSPAAEMPLVQQQQPDGQLMLSQQQCPDTQTTRLSPQQQSQPPCPADHANQQQARGEDSTGAQLSGPVPVPLPGAHSSAGPVSVASIHTGSCVRAACPPSDICNSPTAVSAGNGTSQQQQHSQPAVGCIPQQQQQQQPPAARSSIQQPGATRSAATGTLSAQELSDEQGQQHQQQEQATNPSHELGEQQQQARSSPVHAACSPGVVVVPHGSQGSAGVLRCASAAAAEADVIAATPDSAYGVSSLQPSQQDERPTQQQQQQQQRRRQQLTQQQLSQQEEGLTQQQQQQLATSGLLAEVPSSAPLQEESMGQDGAACSDDVQGLAAAATHAHLAASAYCLQSASTVQAATASEGLEGMDVDCQEQGAAASAAAHAAPEGSQQSPVQLNHTQQQQQQREQQEKQQEQCSVHSASELLSECASLPQPVAQSTPEHHQQQEQQQEDVPMTSQNVSEEGHCSPAGDPLPSQGDTEPAASLQGLWATQVDFYVPSNAPAPAVTAAADAQAAAAAKEAAGLLLGSTAIVQSAAAGSTAAAAAGEAGSSFRQDDISTPIRSQGGEATFEKVPGAAVGVPGSQGCISQQQPTQWSDGQGSESGPQLHLDLSDDE